MTPQASDRPRLAARARLFELLRQETMLHRRDASATKPQRYVPRRIPADVPQPVSADLALSVDSFQFRASA